MTQSLNNRLEVARTTSLADAYGIVFFAALALYVITCAPGPVWQDSGMIQYRVWHNDITGGLGLALAHPLFYLLAIGAKYVPLGQFAHRVNLVSAVTAALAVANLFLLVRLWVGEAFSAAVAATTLAVSHTFWRHATIPETYDLYVALLLAELIMLLQYRKTGRLGYLYLLGLFNGLAIANHMLASIGLACYAVLIVVLLARKHIAIRHVAVMGCLWVVGAGPYECLIVKGIIQSGDVTGTLASAAFGNRWAGDVLNTQLTMRVVRDNLLFIMLNFATPNALLFFVGGYALVKQPSDRVFVRIVVVLLVMFLAFAFRYTIVDRYAFFIPFYCMVAIFMGQGCHWLVARQKRKALAYAIAICALAPIFVYAAAPGLAQRICPVFAGQRQIPYRDSYRYFLQPWRIGYRGAERFANEALSAVEANAMIYADGTTVYPLLHAQEVLGFRPDVTIVTSHGSANNLRDHDEQVVDRLFATRAVYVVSLVPGYCPQFLLKRYDFKPTGVLYRAVVK